MISSFIKGYDLDFADPDSYESLDDVVEKLNYYRRLSTQGLNNLSNADYLDLNRDIEKFFISGIALPLRMSGAVMRPIYRVMVNKRITGNNHEKLNKISNLMGPPDIITPQGRCNVSRSRPIFYGSLDLYTALFEARVELGDNITIGKWKVKENKILEGHLVFHPDLIQGDFYRQHYERAVENIPEPIRNIYTEILRFLTEEFLKIFDNGQQRNYLFSSYFSHLTHWSPPIGAGIKLDTLFYPSTKVNGSGDLAILNSVVLDKMELIDVKKTTIVKLQYNDNNITELELERIRIYNHFDYDNDAIIDDGIERFVEDVNDL